MVFIIKISEVFNFIMGFAVGSCSGFSFYHSVSSLMRDPSVFFSYCQFMFKMFNGSSQAVILHCSGCGQSCTLFVKSQRKDFDRDTFTMCKDKLVV